MGERVAGVPFEVVRQTERIRYVPNNSEIKLWNRARLAGKYIHFAAEVAIGQKTFPADVGIGMGFIVLFVKPDSSGLEDIPKFASGEDDCPNKIEPGMEVAIHNCDTGLRIFRGLSSRPAGELEDEGVEIFSQWLRRPAAAVAEFAFVVNVITDREIKVSPKIENGIK